MQEAQTYRERTILVTDEGPIGHQADCVLSKSTVGWHIFDRESEEIVHLRSGVVPILTLEAALEAVKNYIDEDILESAEWDNKQHFRPEVIQHVVQREVKAGAFRLNGSEHTFNVPLKLDLILRLHNALDGQSPLREELAEVLRTLAPSVGMGTLMGVHRQTDGSLAYDDDLAAAEVHRRKLERPVKGLQEQLGKIAEGLRTVSGHEQEGRHRAASAQGDLQPLAPLTELSSPAKALTALNLPVLDALTEVAKRAHHYERHPKSTIPALPTGEVSQST